MSATRIMREALPTVQLPRNSRGDSSAEQRRPTSILVGRLAMAACHGICLFTFPLNPIRVARRHAARVGDHRDRRGDDHGDGAGYHDLHRLPPLAPVPAPSRDPGAAEPTLAQRRKPNAIAPPTHAAAPAAHAAGTNQD